MPAQGLFLPLGGLSVWPSSWQTSRLVWKQQGLHPVQAGPGSAPGRAEGPWGQGHGAGLASGKLIVTRTQQMGCVEARSGCVLS